MGIDYVLRRMREDPAFSLIYPICEILGENADEMTAKIHEQAKLLNEPPQVVAAETKAQMVRGMQKIPSHTASTASSVGI